MTSAIGRDQKPLVTFILLAYNQQEYIREAIDAAFAQTYEPLEIILSDDCSTDRTFEIMREMADAYEGLHNVRVRRNKVNLGLIDHVNHVIAIANSDIIVFAAGDDKSFSNRVEKIAQKFFSNPKAVLVHSNVEGVDKNGNAIGLFKPPIRDKSPDLKKLATSSSIYIGASGAIKKSAFDVFGPISHTETYEDLIFGFRGSLVGELVYINEALLIYRKDIGLSSQFRQKNQSLKARRIASDRHLVATFSQRKTDLNKIKLKEGEYIVVKLNENIYKATARIEFYSSVYLFLLGIFSRKAKFYLRAISSETKYILGILK